MVSLHANFKGSRSSSIIQDTKLTISKKGFYLIVVISYQVYLKKPSNTFLGLINLACWYKHHGFFFIFSWQVFPTLGPWTRTTCSTSSPTETMCQSPWTRPANFRSLKNLKLLIIFYHLDPCSWPVACLKIPNERTLKWKYSFST